MSLEGIAKAVGGPVIGGVANALFGGHGKNKAELPSDLQPMRANQIALLNYLTGFGPPPAYFAPMAQGGGGYFPAGGSPANIPPPPRDIIGLGNWAKQYGSPRAWQQAQQQPRGNPAGGGGGANGYSGWNFAQGGMVRGPGGPHDDAVNARLSAGEGVLTAEAVHTFGGPSFVHFLNAIASAQRPQHFAFGGVADQPPELAQVLAQWQAHNAVGPAGVPMGTPAGGRMVGASPSGTPHFALGGVVGQSHPDDMIRQMGLQLHQPSAFPNSPVGWAAQAVANQQAPMAGGPRTAPTGNSAAPLPMIPGVAGPNIDPARTGQAPMLPPAGMPGGGAAPGMGGPPTPDARAKSPMQQRMETYFGPLGVPTTGLQRQAVGGMEQFLASDPYKQARTALDQILGSPGDAFRPDFERSLAQANQTGGRFGSANALMRSTALNDYNSAALKQAIAAAQGIQGLGAQQVNDLTGGYNMGSQYAGQLASGQQQSLQLLLNQLQTAQGASLNVPTQQQSTPFGQFAQGFGGFAQMLPYLNPSAYRGAGPSMAGAPAYGLPNNYG
jgi:hypothetical protein